MTTMITDDYIKEVNNYCLQEMLEMEQGIHPLQIKERIQKVLAKNNMANSKITFLDWKVGKENLVKVDLDGKPYGIYNYQKNQFIQYL